MKLGPGQQRQRLMTLLSKLAALESNDPGALEERDSRISPSKMLEMPDFGSQEHRDTQTLLTRGWVRSRRFVTDLSNRWSREGIYAYHLTEDGKAALEDWRASNSSSKESVEPPSAQRQQSRPRVMVIHGSQDGRVPQIVDKIRLWCYEQGLDALKAADHPNSGRFINEKVDDVIKESDYYIVVLTADEELKNGTFRPRPNALIEMGIVLKTNRRRVCVLKEPKVEMPSDYAGFVTGLLDQWESVLARELKNADLL